MKSEFPPTPWTVRPASYTQVAAIVDANGVEVVHLSDLMPIKLRTEEKVTLEMEVATALVEQMNLNGDPSLPNVAANAYLTATDMIDAYARESGGTLPSNLLGALDVLLREHQQLASAQRAIAAARAVADKLPKGEMSLSSFHAREDLLELREALAGLSQAQATDAEPSGARQRARAA